MIDYGEEKNRHYQVMREYLTYLNFNKDESVLKGGSALLMCYGLDRFSEDLDFDCASKRRMKESVVKFCNDHNFEYRIAKDTDTVERYMIYYHGVEKPLKLEISHRRTNIPLSAITKINGICVYTIDQMAILKSSAYSNRDKIRDFYDMCFICNNYFDSLSENAKSTISVAFEYKGLEQYDYITREQSDDLIDEGKLLEDFLTACDKLGVMNDEET